MDNFTALLYDGTIRQSDRNGKEAVTVRRTTDTMRAVVGKRNWTWVRLHQRGLPVTDHDRRNAQLADGIQLRMTWARRNH